MRWVVIGAVLGAVGGALWWYAPKLAAGTYAAVAGVVGLIGIDKLVLAANGELHRCDGEAINGSDAAQGCFDRLTELMSAGLLAAIGALAAAVGVHELCRRWPSGQNREDSP